MTEPRPLTTPRAAHHAPARQWREALDVVAPYLIAVVAVAVARYPFSSIVPAHAAAAIATVLLATGAALPFFRAPATAHLTWMVVFVSGIVLLPLLALHVRMESVALAAPVPAHLLPLLFTWTAIVAVATPLIGGMYVCAADEPAWAGVLVAPLALFIGVVPILSVNPSQRVFWSAAIALFSAAGCGAAVAWLIPERRRWPAIPLILAIGALAIARAFLITSHHLPGRILFVGDATLAVALGIIALAAPALCRWLSGSTTATRART